MKARILFGAWVAVVLSVAIGAQPQQPDYKAALAQATQQMTGLHAQLAACLPYQSAFLLDQLVELGAFKAKFEAANAGKSFDATGLIVDLPKAGK